MNKIKLVCIGFGSVFAFAHLGLVGHLMRLSSNQLPIINLPVGDYTSYTIEAGKEGYRIQYNSNDPKVMGVTKHIDKENGFFGIGGKSNIVTQEQYTMDGSRHLGGNTEGKLSAANLECIKAEGAGESTGRMVGASIASATAAPALSAIPYIGWLASGWAVMLGQDTGADVGGEIATMMNDACDELETQ
tara:strand:+ start:1941 stop:2507 length:567 start_codon:yes stop_codon:yes gene_type:complete